MARQPSPAFPRELTLPGSVHGGIRSYFFPANFGTVPSARNRALVTNSQSPKQPDEPFQRMQSKSRRERTILDQDPQHFQLFPFVSRLWCFSSFSPIIGTVNNSRRLLTSPSLLSWLGRTWQKAHWCVLEPFSRHGRRKCVHGKLVKPFTVLPQRTSSFKHSVRCSRLPLVWPDYLAAVRCCWRSAFPVSDLPSPPRAVTKTSQNKSWTALLEQCPYARAPHVPV